MLQFRVKVYLGEKNRKSFEINPLDPAGSLVPFLTRFTAWTFVTSPTRLPHTPATKGILYKDCVYIDGSPWRLAEIDECVTLSQVEIRGSFVTHQRKCQTMPLYPDYGRSHAPDKLSPEVVGKHFPLSKIYGLVNIGGTTYEHDAKSGTLAPYKDIADTDTKSEAEQQRRARAIRMFNSGAHYTTICTTLDICYETYLKYTKEIRPYTLLKQSQQTQANTNQVYQSV
jgi:hypothetical protein